MDAWEDRVRAVLAAGSLPEAAATAATTQATTAADMRGGTAAGGPYSGVSSYLPSPALGQPAVQAGPFGITPQQTRETDAYDRQRIRLEYDFVMRFVNYVAGRKGRDAENEYITSEYVLFKESTERGRRRGGDPQEIDQCRIPWDFMKTWCPRMAAAAETAFQRYVRVACSGVTPQKTENEFLRHPKAWQAWAIATYVIDVQTSFATSRARYTKHARMDMPLDMFAELTSMRRILQEIGWAATPQPQQLPLPW